MIINNIIRLEWSVYDPVYPYQNAYEYTMEEYAALNMTSLRAQQEQEYTVWLDNLKAMEQG
jgi:hypothetical protein